MEIIGRITADATIGTTKGNKQVVNFSVAVNETYRNQSGERVVLTEYYRCSYWRAAKIAQHLKKGVLVQLQGWTSCEAWTDKEGQARANLNFRTANIQFHSSGTPTGATSKEQQGPKANRKNKSTQGADQTDDLPF